MKRTPSVLVTCLLLVSLMLPATAFAGKGNGRVSGGRGHQRQAASAAAPHGPSARHGKSAKTNGEAKHRPDRATTKAQKSGIGHKGAGSLESTSAIWAGHKGGRPGKPSDEASGTGSAEVSRTVGPGIANAFARITANLEKSLAKIAAGKKSQLPPGLVGVWMKFAAWLGVDQSLMPGYVPPAGSTDDSGSVTSTITPEPTGTVEPTATIEPTSSVDASAAVQL